MSHCLVNEAGEDVVFRDAMNRPSFKSEEVGAARGASRIGEISASVESGIAHLIVHNSVGTRRNTLDGEVGRVEIELRGQTLKGVGITDGGAIEQSGLKLPTVSQVVNLA